MCNQIMVDPSTLHCAHSFCLTCITNSDSWQCPVKECALPISMRGTKRSYININPQLSSVITSLTGITNSIDSMKDGWWKRPNGTHEEDGDDDGAPAVSFSSSDSPSSSPRTEVAVSFAVENNRSIGGGGSVATAAVWDTPSPPTSCLRKTSSPPKSNPRECSIDSTSEYESIAIKKAKTTTTTIIEGEESLSKQQDEVFFHHHSNDTTTPSPTITTTNNNINNEEDNSDATQIYTVDDIQNSEAQLYHDFGDGSLYIEGSRRTANCWSSETHTLDQSCAIPSEGPDISPIAKVGSQSQSQVVEVEVEQEPRLLDGDESEVEGKRIPSSNSSNHNDGGEGDGNLASKELDIDLNSEEGNQPLTITITTTTTTMIHQRRDTTKKDCKQNKITTALEAEATSTSIKPQSQFQRLKPYTPNFNANSKPPIDNNNEDLTFHAPFVFLLSSPMSLSASDLRCLRRCVKKENFFMLQNDITTRVRGSDTNTGDVIRPCSDLDFNFNFELEEDTASFLETLFQSIAPSKSTLSSSPEDKPSMGTSASKSKSNHSPPFFVSTLCCYAICSNSEFQTCDGFIAPRSFQYLLAVACGLPIVDISYIRSAAASSGGGHSSNGGNSYLHALEATMENKPRDDGTGGGTTPPRARNKRTTRGKNDSKLANVGKVPFRIVGDVQSSDWTGPKRARAALLERLPAKVDSDIDACTVLRRRNSYNNGLLAGYTVILCGTYDTLPVGFPSQPRKGGRVKRSRAKSNTNTITAADKLLDETHHPNLYSRGRLSLLLTLCGAEVLVLETFSNESSLRCTSTSTASSPDRKVVILSNGRDRCFSKFARQLAAAAADDIGRITVSVVTNGWVLDSIAEFRVQNIKDYEVKTSDE